MRDFIDITIPVPWGKLAGRWYGNRQLRPLLALHGYQDNLGTWNTLIPLLPEEIGILCLDLPGHGRSSKYPNGVNYHVYDFVDTIVRVVNHFNWCKVSLLAHSMSGMLSFIYTCVKPQQVDMVIALDMIKPLDATISQRIAELRIHLEQSLAEEENRKKLISNVPKAFTFERGEYILHKGTDKSIDIVHSKHILERNVRRSEMYPDKYYFSRDNKIKFAIRYMPSMEQLIHMAERVHNVPFFIAKFSDSHFLAKDTSKIMNILQRNNPDFEFHTIEGTHHSHLNNPDKLAVVLLPFIKRNFKPQQQNNMDTKQMFKRSNL